MKNLINFLEKYAVEIKFIGLMVFLILFVSVCSSCARNHYLYVTWVDQEGATCMKENGKIIKAGIEDGVDVFAGDTLIHIGNREYFNITE